ncbi:hypothetical protein Tco_0393958 [Tanacetum coccineum]
MHKKFQMSSMGELTFFLGLQVTLKDDGIFISQDKFVDEILKKFGFSTVKTASKPMETSKPLLKDAEAEDVDVHLYRSMIRSLMYLTALKPYPKDSPFDLEAYTDSDYAGVSLDRKSTTGGCQFLGSSLISWQYKKKTIVDNSTTEVKYVAADSCCGQVLWIQNQMLDYGYNFMNTKIFIDNKSTVCIVKNPVFHSKTKHIKIRHHFIRDLNEKKLIQMIKIHTAQNVVDLLIKAFDVGRFQYLIATEYAQMMLETAADDVIQVSTVGLTYHWAATTTSSLEAEQDSGNINRTQSMTTLNESFPQGTDSGSGPRPITLVEVFSLASMTKARFEDERTTTTIVNPNELNIAIPDQVFEESIIHTPDKVEITSDNDARDQASELFWASAKAKIVNGERQIQALVDKKKVIITETSIGSDLKLDDAEGIDLPTATIFAKLERMGLQKKVLDLEKAKTAQAKEISSLKKRVKQLEKKQKLRTPGLKRLRKVGSTSRVESSNDVSLGNQEDASKQGRRIIDLDSDVEVTLVDETQEMNDENLMFDTDVLKEQEKEVAEKEVSIVDPVTTAGKVVTTANVEATTANSPTTTIDKLTLAQTLIEIKAAKPKVVTSVATTTTTTRPKARGVAKDKGKVIMVEPERPLKKGNNDDREFARQKEEEANIALIESWDNNAKVVKGSETRTEESSKRAGDELEFDMSKKQKIDKMLVADYERVLWGDMKVMFEPDIKMKYGGATRIQSDCLEAG